MSTSPHIHYTGDAPHTQLATVVLGSLSWIYRCRIARHRFSGEMRMAQSVSGCHMASFHCSMKEIKMQGLVECEILRSCLNTLSATTGWYWELMMLMRTMYRSYSRYGFGQSTWLMAHLKRFLLCWEKSPKLETSWLRLCQKSLEPCRSATPGTPQFGGYPAAKKCCNCGRKPSGICKFYKPQPCNQ